MGGRGARPGLRGRASSRVSALTYDLPGASVCHAPHAVLFVFVGLPALCCHKKTLP